MKRFFHLNSIVCSLNMWIVSLTQRNLNMFQIHLSFQSQPISLELTGMREHSSFAFQLRVLYAQMITDTNMVCMCDF